MTIGDIHSPDPSASTDTGRFWVGKNKWWYRFHGRLIPVPVDAADLVEVVRIGAMDYLKEMLIDSPRTAANAELDDLTGDADRATRRRLGEQYSPVLAAATERYEWLATRGSGFRATRRSPNRP
jgi:hypothetical protein